MEAMLTLTQQYGILATLAVAFFVGSIIVAYKYSALTTRLHVVVADVVRLEKDFREHIKAGGEYQKATQEQLSAIREDLAGIRAIMTSHHGT